jgi:hypothetical protein
MVNSHAFPSDLQAARLGNELALDAPAVPPTTAVREESRNGCGRTAVLSATALRRRPSHSEMPDGTRPLGPKAAALHARRQQMRAARAVELARASRDHGRAEQLALVSTDRKFRFVLRHVTAELYVERTQRDAQDAQVVQSMVFDGWDAFLRWCDADPVRFDQPVLHQQLRRHGDEFFNARG